MKTGEETNSENSEKKIVNLFEDMNHHEHDEKSYEKMKQSQENSEEKKFKPKHFGTLNLMLLGLWYF
jgi:hypothetical protein